MIDERALQAAIPVGSNMANAELVRAIIEAYLSASAGPVAEPDVYRVRAHGNWLYFTDAETAHGSAEMHGTTAQPLYTHPGAPNV